MELEFRPLKGVGDFNFGNDHFSSIKIKMGDPIKIFNMRNAYYNSLNMVFHFNKDWLLKGVSFMSGYKKHKLLYDGKDLLSMTSPNLIDLFFVNETEFSDTGEGFYSNKFGIEIFSPEFGYDPKFGGKPKEIIVFGEDGY